MRLKGNIIVIFCDLDGVLANFDECFQKWHGVRPDEISRLELWEKVQETPHYWERLELIADAPLLIDYLNRFDYQILTGLPKIGYESAERQKKKWVQNHLGNRPVICCLSKDKPLFGQPGDILIDDYPSNIKAWNKMGGIGILHQSAQETIESLKRLHIK